MCRFRSHIPPGESVLQFLIDAIKRCDPRMKNVWFDVAGIVRPDMPAADVARMAQNIRGAGVDRILYGSDSARGGKAWAAFRTLPLTEAEFARRICGDGEIARR
jgi:predicted TIM-barrel fold metal-dependent hydrolase